ncbi:hypothetical protein WKR88_28325 [Trinickia caryophylli]|uniref:Uncharacterized protein n=1 Tax=Trinickia caryophylli TaxID=28094 RepID=A0A1X7HBX8_TRICW|nr:hypothetical protein [Trinickia caryophylli]PMS08734.1 hypothetical protein C0Z17_28660 [Trinickia caryophylli]TRX19014.1 hypothetical protein FNF07_12750 [Trinickia caryophylli]WQE10187.1 hypothetical protein U0034_10165 [Trinickia caryophylli]SMF82660.1 hypothetical protein SAMN06295900_12715 [Trinickia caryophylli]GLU35851.1 hypothetical protein Busp01_56930 [Trinickia caryophylli]
MNRTLSMLAVACLAGCATKNHVSPETMQIATAPLVCTNAGECARWWSRAHDWVVGHSAYALQTSTDSLIATAGPDGGSAALAYQITRTQNADGSSTIGFAAHCDSMIGCRPDPWKAGAAFKQFVKTGVEPPAQPTTGAPPPQ